MMNRSFVSKLLWISFPGICMCLCLAGLSYAQSAKLEKEKKANSNKANMLWEKVAELKKDSSEIHDIIEKIDKRVEAKEQQIEGINTQLKQAEDNRAKSENERVALEKKVGEHKHRLSERARTLYMQGELSYLDVMFNVADFGELVDRMFFVQTILEQDQQIVTETRAAQAELEVKVQSIAFQITEIAKIKENLEAERKELQRIAISQKETNQAIESDIDVYVKEIRELEAANKRIMADIKALTASQSYSGKAWKGAFARPCDGNITSPYGMRIHPIYKRKRMHTGVDIGAPKGTPIKASGDGKVVIAKYYGGYGNTVIIDHGEKRSTLYGHMSKITCKAGDIVKGGAKIGEVGSTGTSTGNHCHFEVRINGDPIDPMKSVK